MEEEKKAQCENCEKYFPESKIDLHEAYCIRNIKKCEQCGEFIDKNEIEEHNEQEHQKKPCKYCQVELEPKYLETHQELNCIKRPVQCQFCDMTVTQSEKLNHEGKCGTKTKICQFCNKYIQIRDYDTHYIMCQSDQIKKQEQEKQQKLMEQQQQQQQQLYQKKPEIKSSNYQQQQIKNNDQISSSQMQRQSINKKPESYLKNNAKNIINNAQFQQQQYKPQVKDKYQPPKSNIPIKNSGINQQQQSKNPAQNLIKNKPSINNISSNKNSMANKIQANKIPNSQQQQTIKNLHNIQKPYQPQNKYQSQPQKKEYNQQSYDKNYNQDKIYSKNQNQSKVNYNDYDNKYSQQLQQQYNLGQDDYYDPNQLNLDSEELAKQLLAQEQLEIEKKYGAKFNNQNERNQNIMHNENDNNFDYYDRQFQQQRQRQQQQEQQLSQDNHIYEAQNNNQMGESFYQSQDPDLQRILMEKNRRLQQDQPQSQRVPQNQFGDDEWIEDPILSRIIEQSKKER
ncbi:hypothetical protein PPERSA_01587 [Pseudocohnilembus persalinus]|uniref:TRAF-type domain-containing protein n=1 Tax=Pseudocohnilembus persalinus TaxID=266149 RepID=A0A0V0QI23_PSEPJ|nr:hypothetical protein PPERSA_01587 [Pseudocohnilembus persalinus]|eukprot:KRX01717.1 hypothetical protein PPERSA_01587 [Pseudocohnilembus persalinus]